VKTCDAAALVAWLSRELPPGSAAAGGIIENAPPPFGVETAVLGRASSVRRAEFQAGPACALQALAVIGLAAVAIPKGLGGEPVWPRGIVGSITHAEA
jgi:hypothetical protein